MTPVQAERHRRKIINRITRIARLPATAENRQLLNRERLGYARSSAVKFAIMMRWPAYRLRTDYDVVLRKAQGIDVLSPCADPVRWWMQPKATGGYRPICCLPPELSLGQRIARDLVEAQFTPAASVFDWPRRGPHRYVTHLAATISARGPYVMTMDLRSCYQHVDIEAVYRLDLIPPELIRSTIDHREFSYHRVQNPDENVDNVVDRIVMHVDPTDPSGLLQGGPGSSSILAALLHGTTESVVSGLPCQSYSDNFTIVGSTEGEVVDAAGDIARYVTGLRSGRLEFRQELQDARQGFEHLGYRFEQRPHDIAILLPERKLYRALEKLEGLVGDEFASGHIDLAASVRQVLAPHCCVTNHDVEMFTDHAELHLHGLRSELLCVSG